MVTCNKILLALSHSFNLIIYCLTSKSFRSTVYTSLVGSNPEQRSEYPEYQTRDAFWTAATCILEFQELMEQEPEQGYMSKKRKSSVTHLVFKDGTSLLIRSQRSFDHRLAYLDLAVTCHLKKDHPRNDFLASKRRLRFQTMLNTRNKFLVNSLST